MKKQLLTTTLILLGLLCHLASYAEYIFFHPVDLDTLPVTQYITNVKYDLTDQIITFVDEGYPDHKPGQYYRMYVYEHDEDAPLYYYAIGANTREYGIIKETKSFLGLYNNTNDGYSIVPSELNSNTFEDLTVRYQKDTIFNGKNAISWGIGPDGLENRLINNGLLNAYVVVVPYWGEIIDPYTIPGTWKINGAEIHIAPVYAADTWKNGNSTYDRHKPNPNYPTEYNYGTDQMVTYKGWVLGYRRTTASYSARNSILQKIESFSQMWARTGEDVEFTVNLKDYQNSDNGEIQFFLSATSSRCLLCDYETSTFAYPAIKINYPIYRQNKSGNSWGDVRQTGWSKYGQQVTINLTGGVCTNSYEIDSKVPVKATYNEATNQISFIMPNCPVTIKETVENKRYKVVFKDHDGTNLNGYSGQLVNCGDDAVAPAAPQHDGLTFLGWSDSYTDIHEDKTIYAQYRTDWLDFMDFSEFTSAEPEFPGRAHIGDQLKFQVKVFGEASIGIRAQVSYDGSDWGNAQYQACAEGEADWGFESDPITYNIDNSFNFRDKFAFRYHIHSGSIDLYTEPYEFQIFYPLTIHNQTDEDVVLKGVDVVTIPAKSSVKIWEYYNHEILFAANPCCQFALKNTTWNAISHDEDSNIFKVTEPGKEDELTITMPTYKVYYEVIGSGNKLGINNVVKIDTVPCGGNSVAPIYDNDPNYPNTTEFEYWMDGATGQEAVLNDIHEDMFVTAMFRDLPALPTYTVTFLDWDDTVLSVQTINEGEDAEEPEVSGREGYIFLGWDKSTKTISEDMTITAVYSTFLPSMEGLQEIFSGYNVPTQKVLYNGHIYIIRDQRIYDAQGRLVE